LYIIIIEGRGDDGYVRPGGPDEGVEVSGPGGQSAQREACKKAPYGNVLDHWQQYIGLAILCQFELRGR
jgi:hypothetical protein